MLNRLSVHPALRAALALTLLAIGLALFYNGGNLLLYAGTDIALLVGLSLALWYPGLPDRLWLGPAGAVLLALFGWTALTIFWSAVPYLSVISLGVIGAALATYLSWRLLLSAPAARPVLALGGIGLGLLIALTMLTQIVLGQRPVATFLNPNSAAGFVNLLWPVSAALAVSTRPGCRARAALWVATAIMVFAVGIDGSRAAALAAAVVLGVLALCSVRAGAGRRVLLLVAIVVAALVLANLANTIGFGGRGETLVTRLASLNNPEAAGSTRWPIYQAAWEMVQARPWLGWGPGTFFQAYPAFRMPGDTSAGFFVHNDYLQYWVERGLPGVVLLLALVAVCAWLFLRGLRRESHEPAGFVLRAAAAAALAGAAVHALFSYNLHVLPFVIVFGVAIAALEIATPAPGTVEWSLARVRCRSLAALALAGLLSIPAVHLVRVAASYHYTVMAERNADAGDYARAEQQFTRARHLWQMADPAWGGAADLYRRVLETLPQERTGLRAAAFRSGMALLDGARRRNPLRAATPTIRGELYLQPPQRDLESARAAFRHALRLDPRLARARVDLARLERDAGHIDQALALVEQALARPSNANPAVSLLRLGVALRRHTGDQAGAQALQQRLHARISNPH